MKEYRSGYRHSHSIAKQIFSLIQDHHGEVIAIETLLSRISQKKRYKKKGNTRRNSESHLRHLIEALHGIGYLIKKKKNFVVNPEFLCRGTMKFTGMGKACIQLDDGYELPIRKGDSGTAQHGDMVMFEFADYHNGQLYVRVTNVHSRKKDRFLARIERAHHHGYLLSLLDTPAPLRLWAPPPTCVVCEGHYAFVTLSNEKTPLGQKCIIDEAFPPDDERYDAQRIIVKHGLPEKHRRYRELAKIDEIIERELPGRKDYRNLFTITIDGATAKDFDDALSLEEEGNLLRLYVHIADVSSFVKKGSALDKEALLRGNSYYIGDRVVPMLPEILSNEYCSLKEGVDRLTLSAELLFDKDGTILHSSFHRGIINVNKRLTYDEADEIITRKEKSELKALLTKLDSFTRILKEKRMAHGRIDLNIPNEELVYRHGEISDILFGKRLISHRIIEESMLSANQAASKLLREAGIPTLYRIHEAISEEKLFALVNFFKTLGLKFNTKVSVGTALQQIIDASSGKEYEHVVNLIILRSFMQAYYGTNPIGHFGLGFRDYTHFTSPIRRYSDLVVHRCIKALLNGEKPPYGSNKLDEIGEKTSMAERIQMKAERDYLKLKSCRLLFEKKGEIFDVIITGVSRVGLSVSLIDKPIEGLVPLWTLTDDHYLVNEDEFTVVGKRLGRRFRIGDKVRARLSAVDLNTLHIDFTII
ncbi:MAG: VacB/RNase II family 3'-5' exoribonuclease [Spirochaetes bacterium]|nr:VacB/RNase II family 3'-5' exoribonuclease [Spirochaetota bacterium]